MVFLVKPKGWGINILIWRTKTMVQQFLAVLLDENGDELWNRAYELPDAIFIYSNNVGMDGTYQWMVGETGLSGYDGLAMKLGHDGEIDFMKYYTDPDFNNFDFFGLEATPDNGFIVVGRKTIPNMPVENDFIIAKVGADGQVDWSKLVKGNAPGVHGASGQEVFVKPDGSGYICRYSQQGGQSYWLSFGLDGELEYAKTYYRENGDPLFFNVIKNDGQFYATNNSPNNNNEIFLVQYDPLIGPAISCIAQEDELLETVELDLRAFDFTYTPISDQLDIQDTTFTTTANDYYLSRSAICSDALPCPEICDNDIDDDLDGYVDCFDEDCDCFQTDECGAEMGLSAEAFKTKVSWISPTNWPGVSNVPIVANLDPQNGDIPEIIIAEGPVNVHTQTKVNKLLIYQGDGSNADNPDVLTLPQFPRSSSAQPIGDVNGDGIPELAIVTWNKFVKVYSNFTKGGATVMTPFATSFAPTKWFTGHLELADFDSDGIPELYVGDHVLQFDLSDPNNPKLNQRLVGGEHAAFNGATNVSSVAADILSVADCNGDPDCEGLELVCGANIYSIDLDPLDGDWYQIKVMRDLNTMVPGGNFDDGYSYVADVNLDGALDVVTMGSHGPNDYAGGYIWDKNGLLGSFHNPDLSTLFNRQFSPIAIANVFDDRTEGFALDFPEIIYPTRTRLTSFNLQAAVADPDEPYWWSVANQDESGFAGPSCFDFNNDGFAEILLRDERYFKMIYGGPMPLPGRGGRRPELG